ncbi:MAG TPA: SMC-Scp complex subunit ScpB [Bryobacteraceae bacterium]|nr:SMC-Scp complex subunit ScpB [Bryobacteraceae bacterium]
MEELETPPVPEAPEENAASADGNAEAAAEEAPDAPEDGGAVADAEGTEVVSATAEGATAAPSGPPPEPAGAPEAASEESKPVAHAESTEVVSATAEGPTAAPFEPPPEPSEASEAASEEPVPPLAETGPTEPGSAPAEATAVAPSEAPLGETAAPEPANTPDAANVEAAEAVQTSMEDLLAETPPAASDMEDARLRAVLEAIIYVAEEPLTLAQLAAALRQPGERIRKILEQLAAEYDKPEHGITVREVAGGYKMATKPEHHEGVRSFVKSLKPPLKLSLPALETLAVIAYKQPVTAPEIMEIRGVQGAGVLKTLLDRKLIAVAGRKNVIGKPILYKTTKEFLIQFGLKDLSELPSLKEFEEIRRMALSEGDVPAAEPPAQPAPAAAEPLPPAPSAAEAAEAAPEAAAEPPDPQEP